MLDPTIGRWTTSDPIEFDAGDVNLFRYLGNNPVNATDPSGLQADTPIAIGHLADGQRAGAGTVSFQHGFKFSTLSTTFKPRAGNARDAWILSSSRELFDKLIEVAKKRRAARLGDYPGRSYSPGFVSDQNAVDPSRLFATYLWDNFVSRAGDLSKRENREKLLIELTKRDPKVFRQFGRTPGTANNFAGRALEGTGSTSKPPIPLLTTLPGSTKPVVGSKYLLGHWQDPIGNIDFDMTAQAQNFTQVYHFNTGMGWYRVGEKDPGTEKWFPGLSRLVTDDSIPVRQRKYNILKWLVDNGHVGAHFFREELRRIKKEGGKLDDQLERVNTTVSEKTEEIEKRLKTDTLASRLFASLTYDGLIRDNWSWKEAVDVVRIANGFKEQTLTLGYKKYISPSSLDVYAAYEVASTEGFHLFGIDSINDLIATEAGRLFAEELLTTRVPITKNPPIVIGYLKDYVKTSESVDIYALLQSQFSEARKRVATHPVFQDRAAMQEALFSVLMATNRDGVPVSNVLNGMHDAELRDVPIWKATLVRIMSDNAATWPQSEIKERGTAFIQEVATFISDVRNRTASAKEFPSGGRLTGDQIRTLDQIVEVLMFFEDIPAAKKP